MGRTLPTALTALLNAGHCRQHSTVDLTLTSGTVLHLSTAENEVGGIQYLAQLVPLDVFKMTLESEVDQVGFAVQNVDMVMGRTLTGATRQLDGAEGMLGVIFVDDDTGAEYFVEKMPGELVAGEVSESQVAFQLVSHLDIAVVSGRTISTEFEWIEPIAVTPFSDPNAFVPPGWGGGGFSGGGGGHGGGNMGDPSGPPGRHIPVLDLSMF